MAMIPNKLKPSDVVKLVNSTAAFGYVLNERQLRRHRERAGFRITDDGGQSLKRSHGERIIADIIPALYRGSNLEIIFHDFFRGITQSNPIQNFLGFLSGISTLANMPATVSINR